MHAIADNSTDQYTVHNVTAIIHQKKELAGNDLLIKLALAGSDIAAFIFAFIISYQLSHFWQAQPDITLDYLSYRLIPYSVACLLAVIFIATSYCHYTVRKVFWNELRDLWVLTLILAVIDAAFSYASKLSVSRHEWLFSWLTLLVILPVFRLLTKQILITTGHWIKPTIIIGTGDNAKATLRALQSESSLGYEVRAFIDTNADSNLSYIEQENKRIPVFSLTKPIEVLLEDLSHPHIIIAPEEDDFSKQREIIERMAFINETIHVIPPSLGIPLFGLESCHFFSHDILLLHGRNNLLRPLHQLAKRLFDLVAASIGLILLAPLFIYIGFRIWLADGFPIIYWQERVGKNGKMFRICKFRSMVRNANEVLIDLLDRDPAARKEWLHDHKLKNDPRITPIGKFLRETSLDEIPQLWNVFTGSMSLVGPRPIVQDELNKYAMHKCYYLEAKPGITGLWQVSGRNNTNYKQRVNFDVWYVKNWSLWHDFVILLKTIKVIIHRTGAY